MSYVIGLKCKECGNRAPVSPVHVCEACFGPYEVEYDYAAMKGKVTRESISAGPRSLWRYKDLLPVNEPKTGFNSGFTPLRKAQRLGKELGCTDLWIKDDSCNYPTYSYKERVVSVAISKAIEFGFDTVGCASTGNLANSTAAHAAMAGIRCFVMIPHDLEQGKVLGSLIFGPTMVRIRGTYDDVNRLCTEIADKYGWAIVNVNLRPYYTEGAKTYGFEIAEQMGWRLPQHTVVPTAGGTILPKVYKAYREFIELGLVEDNQPKIYSAQAAGCNPVVKAIHKGDRHHRAAEAQHHRQEHRHRQSGRWVLRLARRQRFRRLGRKRHRSGDRRCDQAAGQHRRNLDRAGRRNDAGGGDEADPAGADSQERIDRHQHHRQRPENAGGGAGRSGSAGSDRGQAFGVRCACWNGTGMNRSPRAKARPAVSVV